MLKYTLLDIYIYIILPFKKAGAHAAFIDIRYKQLKLLSARRDKQHLLLMQCIYLFNKKKCSPCYSVIELGQIVISV